MTRARLAKWRQVSRGYRRHLEVGVIFVLIILSMGVGVARPPTSYAIDDPSFIETINGHEVVYFYSPQCPRCQKVEEFLEALNREYIGLIYITKHDMSTREGESYRHGINSQFNIADSMALAVPAVFFRKPFIGEASIMAYLETEIISALISSKQTEPSDFGEQGDGFPIGQLETLAWVPIVMAGALDGVNPCAFSILIFLIVTLSLTKGQWRVFITGCMFCLAAFITNLSIGLGVVSLSSMARLALVGRIAYLIGGILALAVGIGSLIDSGRSRGRQYTPDPVLGLPKPLRSLSKGVIRKWNETKISIMYPFLAFATGMVVALFEFPCTGQVYLPTIAFMLGHPHYRYRATFYLVLYNFMYVLPLVAVLILSIWLSDPRRVARYFGGRICLVKLITGCLFILLGVYMIFQQFSW
jgi:thiol-disulfide isomerase/thioredoxin/putative Ca2+/H+ antiporter (TMEM165/GDT1 family)